MESEERYEYDEVTLLSPFAVGAPGKRTFFLAIGKKNDWVRIWVEKEHLQAFIQAVEQLFAILAEEKIDVSHAAEAPPSDEIPSGLPRAELDIVQMILGYDEEKATIEITVQRSGAQEPNPLTVFCRATLAQIKKFSHQAEKVCAAGRPLCPICGGPIDPTGHVCPAET